MKALYGHCTSKHRKGSRIQNSSLTASTACAGSRPRTPSTVVPIVAILEATDLEMAFQITWLSTTDLAKVPPRSLARSCTELFGRTTGDEAQDSAKLALNSEASVAVGVLDKEYREPVPGNGTMAKQSA